MCMYIYVFSVPIDTKLTTMAVIDHDTLTDDDLVCIYACGCAYVCMCGILVCV
jgi:hypothetical protein